MLELKQGGYSRRTECNFSWLAPTSENEYNYFHESDTICAFSCKFCQHSLLVTHWLIMPIPATLCAHKTLISFFQLLCLLCNLKDSHYILLISAFSNFIFNSFSRVPSKSFKTVSFIVNISLSLQYSETVNKSLLLFISSCWKKFTDLFLNSVSLLF